MNKLSSLRCELLSTSAKNYVNTSGSNNTTPPASTTVEHIVIPNRIQRSPTDILNALSSTVKSDPTAAHFKYHDDPYLIPMSNVTKRTFAMAQEAGRKAAKWIKDEQGRFFLVSFYNLPPKWKMLICFPSSIKKHNRLSRHLPPKWSSPRNPKWMRFPCGL